MQININNSIKHLNFTNSQNSKEKKRVRYKQFKQMSDEVLFVHSVKKAHDETMKSDKMRLYKAIPSIATATITAGIALTQPGKLATKAVAGLGFLALAKGVQTVYKMVGSKDKNGKQKKPGLTFALTCGLVAGAIALTKGLDNNKAFGKSGEFIKTEAQKLAKEINSTKLAKFSDKNINSFNEKHPILSTIGLAVGSCGVVSVANQEKRNLAKDMSNDIINKIEHNFAKGKTIQHIARKHFDSIDAIEITN